jgi:hypothetical protein
MVRHGTLCAEGVGGWFGKVPHVKMGNMDGLVWCHVFRRDS